MMRVRMAMIVRVIMLDMLVMSLCSVVTVMMVVWGGVGAGEEQPHLLRVELGRHLLARGEAGLHMGEGVLIRPH
ncbi:hypothetical protein [Methylorubrum sp. GM97]|uniref:hypothetical protein n=1 Tax=Methylorubrum sp. GM97 TaxID=2938232 RepID=UPI00218C0E60|nr:hypothetical protein [Methylorubrum sp. GM97]BDL38553.1 hypothetical protein MSPGM_11430 [Methylorubrum sp. GM97]